MEMLERCPGCSVAREVEPAKAGAKSRPCAHCGYDGVFLAPEAAASPAPQAAQRAPHRDSLPSFAGARAKLATATQDLFRLSGHYSIPVEAEPPAPPPAPEPPAPSSTGRKAEASIMFSLEALMKTAATPPPPRASDDDMSSQLWNMQAETPLFGTDQDQALLTTPLKMEPAQSMDSMTLPSQTPTARRWLPILVAASAGLALAGAGIWFFGSSQGTPTVNAATPPREPVAIAAPAPAQLAPPAAEPTPPANAQLPAAPAGEPAAAPTETPEPAPTAAEAAATATTPVAGTEPAAVAPPKSTTPSRAPVKKPPPRAVSSLSGAPSSAKVAFDVGAAKKALNAAASQAATCGAGGAPGKGKIQVTFAPSGKVSDAQLVEGPFGGTVAGKCALRVFRAAKVPAFSGAPVPVAKSFQIY
jgi:hypothetical protein